MRVSKLKNPPDAEVKTPVICTCSPCPPTSKSEAMDVVCPPVRAKLQVTVCRRILALHESLDSIALGLSCGPAGTPSHPMRLNPRMIGRMRGAAANFITATLAAYWDEGQGRGMR